MTNFTGNKIKELRQKEGMTQESMGKLLGMSGNAYMYIEQGRRLPYTEELDTLSDLFNVPKTAFFENELVPRLTSKQNSKHGGRRFTQKSVGKPASEDEEDIRLDVEEELPPIPETKILTTEEAVQEISPGRRDLKRTVLEIPVNDRLMKITIEFE
jgi:transcriptional regulator with XRE-family HTH domain